MLILLSYGCANTEKINKQPIMIKEIMHNYFGQYEYIYSDISARGNQNGQFYALIEIDKADLSRDKMNEIIVKFNQNGWVLKENKDNFYHLCNGEKFSLNILFPENIKEYTSNHVPIEFNKMNVWNIFMNKSTTPIAECVNDSGLIIDFNKL